MKPGSIIRIKVLDLGYVYGKILKYGDVVFYNHLAKDIEENFDEIFNEEMDYRI